LLVTESAVNQPPVELLVLSACQTAVGNKEVELGFSGLALQAGVKSAIASFWPVSDAGTLALMSEFYQRLKGAVSKAEALRQAQIAMIRGKVYLQAGELVGSRGTVTVPESLGQDGARSLAHPYYWAGFSLIGSPW
ncbi:MAG: CHAT domain-containing protein, partial [Microcystaceae cyanobacterium]